MNIEASAKQLDNTIDNKTEIIIPKRARHHKIDKFRFFSNRVKYRYNLRYHGRDKSVMANNQNTHNANLDIFRIIWTVFMNIHEQPMHKK